MGLRLGAVSGVGHGGSSANVFVDSGCIQRDRPVSCLNALRSSRVHRWDEAGDVSLTGMLKDSPSTRNPGGRG